MLRIVTTNNVEVFRHLGSSIFQRMGVEHHVALTGEDALDLVRTVKPEVAILDTDSPRRDGYSICTLIRQDPALSSVRVMLVLSSVISRDVIERVQVCGCDDILAPPIDGGEFYRHIAQVAGLPLRQHRRVDVTLAVQLPGAAETVAGEVENLSLGGAGVRVRGRVTPGKGVTVRIVHDGNPWPELPAKIAWARAAGPGEQALGLSFTDVPPTVKSLLHELCLHVVTPSPEGGVVVALQGDFTEHSDFTALAARLRDEVRIEFDARAVKYVSSAGVRAWCLFLRDLEGKSYSFRHCSMALVLQAAMVPMALGTGQVISLEAPYHCSTCDRTELRLLETRGLSREGDRIVPPILQCSVCRGRLVFDDMAERYFAFLAR